MKRPLHWPQVEAVKLIEKHLDSRSGKTITIRSSRQTMKNEVSATVEARALLRYKTEGGSIVKVAPTYRPQIVNSKRRLDEMIFADPLISPKPRGYREGYIKELGLASIQFLSGEKGANVEGATASLLLEIDEAHHIDKAKFEEAFGPMTASTAAPTVMYGVAAAKMDLLYEQRIYNEQVDKSLNLQFPADIWCELIPAYAKHYAERVAKLGEDHPIILTQYRLIDIESMGGFFNRFQQGLIFSGEHERKRARTDERQVVAVIDIAGEDEEGEDISPDRAESGRDQTVCQFWDIDWSKAVNGIPKMRLLDIYFWVGAPLAERNSPSGLPGQQEMLLKLCESWRADAVVVDGRGVGEQIAGYLENNYSRARVLVYKATKDSVSEDCYALLAFVNNGQIKVFKPDESVEYQEFKRQIEHAAKKVSVDGKIAIVKPQNDSKRHIDMVKAMSYLRHCLDAYVVGVLK